MAPCVLGLQAIAGRLHDAASAQAAGVFQRILAPNLSAAAMAGVGAVSVPSALQGASPLEIHDAAVAVHAADPTAYYHNVAVHTWTLGACCRCCYGSVFNGKALARVAGRFARRLHHAAPTTAFAVVAVPDEVGRAGTVGGCFPRWRLGTVQVRGRRSATSAESTATHVYGMAKAGAGSAGTSAAEPVHARGGGAAAGGGVGDGALGTLPPEALFGLAVTLPLPDLLQCLTGVGPAHGGGGGAARRGAALLHLLRHGPGPAAAEHGRGGRLAPCWGCCAAQWQRGGRGSGGRRWCWCWCWGRRWWCWSLRPVR
jgi:hypothetical protein